MNTKYPILINLAIAFATLIVCCILLRNVIIIESTDNYDFNILQSDYAGHIFVSCSSDGNIIEAPQFKEYIEKNLRKDLKVGDIAPAIGVNRTYLSRLFHQEEGITVQQYVQKEKCRHAAQMLQYSDHTIAQIALYLGFSSQSYFGACFQTWYGMTPNAYRRAKQ